MDIEKPTEIKERRVFSSQIEELLEKERNYRQNNQYNESTEILPRIVK